MIRNSPFAVFLLIAVAPPAFGQVVSLDTVQLRRLHVLVADGNPDLQVWRARVVASRAQRASTGFGPAPRLNAEIEELPSGFDISRSQSTRIALAKDFLPAGQRRTARALADSDIEQAELELSIAERLVRIRTDELLVRAAAARAITRQLASEENLLATVERGLNVRFAVADARYVDVLRIRTERLRVRTRLAEARSDERVLLLHLIELAGDAATIDSAGFDSLVSTVPVDSVQDLLANAPAVDSLVATAPAVQQANAALRRATASESLVRAEHGPAWSLALGAQRFSLDNGQRAVGLTLGGSLSLPFLFPRARSTAVFSARQSTVAAEARLRAATLRARSAALQGRERYATARARHVGYASAAFAGIRDERDAAVAAYRNGQMSLLELLDFERALAEAETARYRALGDAAESYAAVLRLDVPDDRSPVLSLEDSDAH